MIDLQLRAPTSDGCSESYPGGDASKHVRTRNSSSLDPIQTNIHDVGIRAICEENEAMLE